MKSKRRLIIFLVIVAIVLFFVIVAYAVLYSPRNDITVPTAAAAHVSNSDYPVRLVIPAIGVDAKVQKVGVTSDSKMAVPTNYTDVGWYEYGTVPGRQGSAVIDGHVDDGLSFPGVFVNLHELKVGDTISITMHSGTVLHFVMTGSQAYDKNYVDTGTIFNDNSGTILRLITCTGSWLPTLRTHSERLVVTAVLQK